MQVQEQKIAVCGNCKHFVVGGKCARVQGEIRVEDICDIHEFGDPYAFGFPVIPPIPKIEVNYRPAYWDQLQDGEYSPVEMREALTKSAIQSEIDRMMEYGIDPTEIMRTIQSYIYDPNKDILDWPPIITGVDNLANINKVKVPSTGEPPIYQPNTLGPTQPFWVPPFNPYPANPTPDPLGAVKTDPSISRTYSINYNPAQPSANWLGLANDLNSEPPTIGVTPYNMDKDPPLSIQGIYPNPDIPHIIIPPSDDAPQFHEITGDELKKKKKSLMDKIKAWLPLIAAGAFTASALVNRMAQEEEPQLLGKYHYRRHEQDDVCYQYNGKVFDLLDTANRPVIPSEGLGYVTTHPNCQCYWTIQKTSKKPPETPTRKQQSDIEQIKGDITKAARKGELHTVKADGSLSKRTRKSNPIREALIEIREEFGWLTDDYISKARDMAQTTGSRLYLVRAASEAITDHRSEGEPLRRKLSGDELSRLARTAISKGTDINHNPNFKTDGMIIDSEYDDDSEQLQMLVAESDPEIIKGIDDHIITAVSINGGSPRSESVEPCDEHCETNCELCLVPKGVVLGELDDIALTWVVTDPRGLRWGNGIIPPATPGVKTTAIQPL